MSAIAERTRVLTGFRPTGPLHVGHWAGNVGNAVRLQDEGYECFYFVADWHMLTTHYDRVDELPAFTEGLVLDCSRPGSIPNGPSCIGNPSSRRWRSSRCCWG